MFHHQCGASRFGSRFVGDALPTMGVASENALRRAMNARLQIAVNPDKIGAQVRNPKLLKDCKIAVFDN